MAQVPTEQQITPEDFPPDDQRILQGVADPFNAYVQENNEALRRNLTFTDNFRGEVKTLTYTQGETLTFSYALPDFKPVGLWVANFYNVEDREEVVAAGVTPQWDQDGKGNITIKNITGLTAGKQYVFTFIIVSG